MSRSLSRREFLKLSLLSLSALALGPLPPSLSEWPLKAPEAPEMLGRAARKNLPVYARPHTESQILRKLPRDALLRLKEEVIAEHGPAHNPRWYRLERGFVHSAYIQRVDYAHLNTPVTNVSSAGRLGEITVPFTRAIYQTRNGGWMQLYRLYYGSVHWVTGTAESPQGEPWYRLTDEWLKVHYYVPAGHVRLISADELAPISPGVPPERKHVVVSIPEQTLTAYEDDRVVLHTRISTGKRYMETPGGVFRVERKHPSKHMGDGGLTGSLDAYELPGVPWVSFFHKAGIAFHGTYWHDNFGEPMSRGCVNMRTEEALWLFRWTSPDYNPRVTDRRGWKVTGEGTRVTVIPDQADNS